MPLTEEESRAFLEMSQQFVRDQRAFKRDLMIRVIEQSIAESDHRITSTLTLLKTQNNLVNMQMVWRWCDSLRGEEQQLKSLANSICMGKGWQDLIDPITRNIYLAMIQTILNKLRPVLAEPKPEPLPSWWSLKQAE